LWGYVHSACIIEDKVKGHCYFLFIQRNNSDEGVYEVHSGISDYERLGEMASYNWKTHLSAWPSEPCNMINGSDGSVLPSQLSRDSILRGFHPDVCRSFYTTFVKDIKKKGIEGYRFEPPEEQYYSARRNKENSCFCPEAQEDFSNCFEDGVYSGAGCHRGQHNIP
jgi:hypothetical protein